MDYGLLGNEDGDERRASSNLCNKPKRDHLGVMAFMGIREGFCSRPSAVEFQAFPTVAILCLNRQNELRRVLITDGTMLVI